MREKFSGKVALVTGAASGIGRSVALRLAKEGAKVSVVDIDLKGAEKVAKEIKDLGGEAIAIQCDVGNEEQVEKAVKETEEKLGIINILVNNAGISPGGMVKDMATELWHKIFNIIIHGTFYFSKAVVKSMPEGGRIINISSLAGITGGAMLSGYSSAKAAVIGFTKCLALETAQRGITVNAIAPGLIDTPMMKGLIEMMPEWYKKIPVQRVGTPEDIAEAVAYLASPGASYITGQVIVLDGGVIWVNPVTSPPFT